MALLMLCSLCSACCPAACPAANLLAQRCTRCALATPPSHWSSLRPQQHAAGAGAHRGCAARARLAAGARSPLQLHGVAARHDGLGATAHQRVVGATRSSAHQPSHLLMRWCATTGRHLSELNALSMHGSPCTSDLPLCLHSLTHSSFDRATTFSTPPTRGTTAPCPTPCCAAACFSRWVPRCAGARRGAWSLGLAGTDPRPRALEDAVGGLQGGVCNSGAWQCREHLLHAVFLTASGAGVAALGGGLGGERAAAVAGRGAGAAAGAAAAGGGGGGGGGAAASAAATVAGACSWPPAAAAPCSSCPSPLQLPLWPPGCSLDY